MVASVRFLEKFVSLSGAVSYTFPLKAYEWESVESLRTAFLESVGMDFAFDALHNAPAPRNVANETVRFIIVGANASAVDTEVDAMKAKLYNIGRGKLYTIDNAGTRRWCYARLTAMPDVRVAVPALVHVPASVQFQRFSPWFAESITTVTTAIVTTNPKTFTVTNAGNVPVKVVSFRFRSNSNTGFTNPALLNSINSYSFSSTRDAASANSELKVDTEDLSVKFSADDGMSYADDFANFTIGSNQGSFFQLEPGDNSIVYTDGGTPDLSLEIAFYTPYA
jgi:hypothetical protein